MVGVGIGVLVKACMGVVVNVLSCVKGIAGVGVAYLGAKAQATKKLEKAVINNK
jgi:hypothetical protein